MLPAYSFMLGLLALLGFFAIAAGVDKLPEYAEGFKQFGNNFAVPALFLHQFPVVVRRRRLRRHRHRRAGAGGDHVDRRRQPLHPQHLPRVHQRQSRPTSRKPRWPNGRRWSSSSARWCSSCSSPTQYAIYLQLLGGIWIIQTLPSLMLGAVHALVQRMGAAGRLGRRHRLGNMDVLRRQQYDDLVRSPSRAGRSPGIRRSTRLCST